MEMEIHITIEIVRRVEMENIHVEGSSGDNNGADGEKRMSR